MQDDRRVEQMERAFESIDSATLLTDAARARKEGHGLVQSYSPKVFIPLTQLCRDSCGYCTFARSPDKIAPAFMSRQQVLAIARAGEKAGCTEALFTLGDKPELRYVAAKSALDRLGHASTISYLTEICQLVIDETGLLPHVNAGVMGSDDIAALRRVSVSQGLMLEGVSPALVSRGGPHFGSPDKQPAIRLDMIRRAGEVGVPFTTGILIGIGETRRERIAALAALLDLHERYGHIQEVIIQNFRAKSGTRMANAAEPPLDELLWTIAVARLIFGPGMNIQAPPNLSPGTYGSLIAAGANDWGGISPVTADHVNPEAPWPSLLELRDRTNEAGYHLVPRLGVYPGFARDSGRWQDSSLAPRVRRAIDAEGFLRGGDWSPGREMSIPEIQTRTAGARDRAIDRVLARIAGEQPCTSDDVEILFSAREGDFSRVCDAADALRAKVVGPDVSYTVNRNINYTNICSRGCRFCAFSKGKATDSLRGKPYNLDVTEIGRRVREAWDRGATEVCLQGGIHPSYTGRTYLGILEAVKKACPQIHAHAFSPLEIAHGARTLGWSVRDYLNALREAGLGSLPGTAAEILVDEVRAVLCADKLSTSEWLTIVGTAHDVGLPTTATIMFGHVDHPTHWAKHLLAVRDLQAATGGFTEFVPLPFVHMEAPIYLKGHARRGPTLREVLLMHAVSRLVLHPVIRNIQTSWAKLGAQGAKDCLRAGANDLGGTLMNESISRAAGAAFGQEFSSAAMEDLIVSLDRKPRVRTTLYADAPPDHRRRARIASPLAPTV